MSVSELNSYYRLGLDLYDKGQLKEAIVAFEEVLREMSPGSPEAKLARFYIGQAHAALAETSLQQGANVSAEEHLREAVLRNPKYPDIHFQLAQVLTEKGELQEAVEHLRVALEINPNYAKATLLLGVLEYQSGSYEKGIYRILRAVELEPRFDTQDFKSAMAAEKSGKHRLALAKFIELSIADFDEITTYINRGKEAYRSGDYDRAAGYFKDALQLKDSYPDVHNWLGLSLLGCKEVDEALVYFKRAIGINKNYVAAIINAGIACDMAGKVEDARAYYTRALVTEPENIEARERLTQTNKTLH